MTSNSRKSGYDYPWWIYLPVYLAPVALFLPALWPGKSLFWGITSLQFVPWHWEALRSLRAGEWPLWNIWNGMGAPLAANYQSALFYPPTWFTLLAGWIGGLSAMAWAHGALIVLHLIWAGWGMKKLAGYLHLSPIPQVICGVAFSLGGYLVARGSFLTMIQAASWIPWIVLAASRFAMPVKQAEEQSASSFDPKAVLWLALAFSGQWLSGHAQLAWYTLLFVLGWLATGAMVNGGWKKLVHIILPVGLSGLLALLVCSIQLIPTIEYFMMSQRSGAIDYQTALSYSYWPWRLLTLIFPDFFGNPGTGDFWGYANYWEDALYFGILPLFLFLYYVFSWRNRKKSDQSSAESIFYWFCVLTICLVFLMALGWNTPVFPWLFNHVPTFGSFNGPTRWNIIAVFCAILLAGFGAEEWIKKPVLKRNHVYMGLVGVTAMLISGFAAIFRMPEVKGSFKAALISAAIVIAGYFLIALIKPVKGSDKEIVRWRFLLILWLLGDMIWAGCRLNPAVDSSLYTAIPAEKTGERYYIPAEAERDLRFKRFFNFEDIRQKEDWSNLLSVYMPNTNILSSVPMLNNFDPMVPDRYLGYEKALEETTPETRQRLLALGGVSHSMVLEGEDMAVRWKYLQAFPEVWISPCAVFTKENSTDGLIRLAEENRLREYILVEAPIENAAICDSRDVTSGEINIKYGGSTRREFQVTGRLSKGWLFMAYMNYPGWTAYLDNRKVDIFPADYAFMAIHLPAGDHSVRLEYEPKSFINGSLLTLAGLILCVILGIRRTSSTGGLQ